jgi:hypothetical protein
MPNVHEDPTGACKPTPADSVKKIFQQLRTLWEGRLYTTIYALYTALIGWLLVWVDWRAALLSFFVISVTHPLRNSVDKLGWELGKVPDPDAASARTYQRRD